MIIFLATILWLGLAGSAGAACTPLSDGMLGCPAGGDERLFTESDVKAAANTIMKLIAEETKHDRACLASMQAAMKAINPFVGPIIRFKFVGSDKWIERKLEDGDDLVKKAMLAQEQWDAAKRCWKDR